MANTTPPEMPPEGGKKSSSKWLVPLIIVLVILCICLVAAGVFAWFYFQDKDDSPAPLPFLPSKTSTEQVVIPLPGITDSAPLPIVPTATIRPTLTTRPSDPILLTYVLGSSYEDRDADIYIVQESGAGSSCVACDWCSETEPSLSTDGQYVVYQSLCPGQPDLYIVSTGGWGAGVLTETSTLAEREPDFSPDGSQIVFRVSGVSDDRNQNGEIKVMNVDGTGIRSLGIWGRGPAWSPDGRMIAYMSNTGGTWQIYVYELASGSTRKITNTSVNCRWPAWSPDSLYVAYNTTPSAGSMDPDAVWYTAADGSGSPRMVVDLEGGAGRPSWSDNGLIAFNSLSGIEVVSPSGTGRYVLVFDKDAWAAAWSR